jgi:hypothetical protein
MKKIVKENRFGRHFDNCRTSAGADKPRSLSFREEHRGEKKKGKGCMDFR